MIETLSPFLWSMETNTGIQRSFRRFPAGPAGADSSCVSIHKINISMEIPWGFPSQMGHPYHSHKGGGPKRGCWSLERSLKTRLYGGPKRWSLFLFLHGGPTKTIVMNGVNEIRRYEWPYKWVTGAISPCTWICFTPFITGFLGAQLVSLLLASKVDRQTNVMFRPSKWMW